MSDIVGHQNVIELLKRTVDEGRPAHAYLFTGREGVGKKRVAVMFACMLNCPGGVNHDDRSCNVCRRIIEEKHPDVFIERPERGKIRIDRIRALQSYFKYAPVEGRYRVTIIDDAHLMNHPSQNALLKTLEEPPPARMLILVSAKPTLLLPTVRSRCRRIRFGAIPVGPLASLLQTERGLSEDKARVLAAVSCGSVGRALKMEDSRFMDLREKVVTTLTDPGRGGVRRILELSTEISGDRNRVLDVIEIASTWIRDVLMEKIGSDRVDVIHGDFLDRISSSAQHQTTEELLSVYEEVINAAELIEAEINVNRNLATDLMLLRTARILAGPTLGVAKVNN